jgi:flagellar motor switch protein FliM
MNIGATEEVARHNLQERLLAGAALSVDRLPGLQAVFENMTAHFTESLRKSSDVSIEFVADVVSSGRAAEILPSFSRFALSAAYRAAEADSRLVIGVDRQFICLMVELLFGSDGSEIVDDPERSLSKVETRLGNYALERLAEALRSSFATTAGISFPMERAEEKLDLTATCRKNGFVFLCTGKLRVFGRESDVFIAIPQAALDPFKGALSRVPSKEASRQDPLWASQLKTRVTNTEVTVRAIMEKRDLTLQDIARFEVGQVITLPVSPTGLIKLECERQALFWCTLGQKDSAYTIRIEDFVDKNEEFIEDVLGG